MQPDYHPRLRVVLPAEHAPAETVVVALAPLEGAVHKDLHYRTTRRA